MLLPGGTSVFTYLSDKNQASLKPLASNPLISQEKISVTVVRANRCGYRNYKSFKFIFTVEGFKRWEKQEA